MGSFLDFVMKSGFDPGVSIGVCFGSSLWWVSSVNLLFYNRDFYRKNCKVSLQLLAMDPSARVTMKDVAKHARRCEWQNSANQENAERNLQF